MDMEQLALLARMELTEQEKAEYGQQVGEILGFFRQLQAVDVTGVEPMAHPFAVPAPMREDVAGAAWPVERGLGNAAAQREDQVVVPKVVEEA